MLAWPVHNPEGAIPDALPMNSVAEVRCARLRPGTSAKPLGEVSSNVFKTLGRCGVDWTGGGKYSSDKARPRQSLSDDSQSAK